MNVRGLILFLVVLTPLIQGCKQNFDKRRWINKEDMEYPDRDAMVDNLINSQKVKGLRYKEVIKLLGEPDGRDTIGIWYTVRVDYGWDIDPIYSKDLLITFNKDSIVKNAIIKEYKND